MTTVSYSYEFPYGYYAERRVPQIPVRISNPSLPGRAVDVDVHFDSGAERSLFNGDFASALEIDLFGGPDQPYESLSGNRISGRLHGIKIFHPQLGEFPLVVGFSTQPIHRNILGRDFFNLIQIGFRERYLSFLIDPKP